MMNSTEITALHDAAFTQPNGPHAEISASIDPLPRWVRTNHRFNCLLWDEEDLARRTKASDAEITANKRAIDGFNQARNDAVDGQVDPLGDARIGLAGAEVRLRRPTDAHRLGIQTAFQEMTLVRDLTVLDNMLLPYAPVGLSGMVRRRSISHAAAGPGGVSAR